MNTLNTPDRIAEIPAQLKLLSEAIDDVGCLINNVADRVHSVIVDEPPEGLPEDEAECGTKLGSDLQTLRFRVESIGKTAKRLANGIEL
jgi:hypothetical protein